MMLPVLLFLLVPLLRAAPTCSPLSINVAAPLQVLPSTFASWTIDPSRNRAFFDTNFSDPHLLYLATHIGGGLIRWGGGGADEITYGGFGGLPSCDAPQPFGYECLNKTTLDAVVALATASGSSFIFAFNVHPLFGPSPPLAPWNATAARGVLQYLRAQHAPLLGVECGNELNHHGFTAAQQSAAFAVLSGVLRELWPDPAQRPALVGPDADGAGNSPSPLEMVDYLSQFVGVRAGDLSAVTHHEYLQVNATSVLDPSYLDHTAEIAAAVVGGIRRVNATVPIFAGEVGPHTGNSIGNSSVGTCGDNLLCGRFGSMVWYADAMGAKAAAGYEAFFRQDLVGASYALINASVPGRPPSSPTHFTPSPDYYFLLLWRRLVGRQVLSVAPSGRPSTLRAYAFCSLQQGSAVTLVLLNLDAAPACLAPPSFLPQGADLTYYTFTPGTQEEGVESWGVQLNGELLQLSAEGLLPNLPGKLAASNGGIVVPPTSVSLVLLPSAAPLSACA